MYSEYPQMKIRGRRTHLGESWRSGRTARQRTAAPQVRIVVPLGPRPSPEPDLVVMWYPHRDAASLLPPDEFRHENHLTIRGHVPFRGSAPRWSWDG